jgi:hypothetical protein
VPATAGDGGAQLDALTLINAIRIFKVFGPAMGSGALSERGFALRNLYRVLAAVSVSVVLLTATATSALADSGGGCATVENARPCISVASGTTDPLLADFYISDFRHGEFYYRLWIYINGAAFPKADYTRVDHIGHYPSWRYTQNKGFTHGSAYTYVEFYNSGFGRVFSASSPTQTW